MACCYQIEGDKVVELTGTKHITVIVGQLNTAEFKQSKFLFSDVFFCTHESENNAVRLWLRLEYVWSFQLTYLSIAWMTARFKHHCGRLQTKSNFQNLATWVAFPVASSGNFLGTLWSSVHQYIHNERLCAWHLEISIFKHMG